MTKLEKTHDTRVKTRKPLIDLDTLRRALPISSKAKQTIIASRGEIEKILKGESSKIIVVLGPCSIHSEEQAMLNGRIIKALQAKVGDTMLLVMRTYFEKPRTITGWKGLLNDPYLDKSFDMNKGLLKARKILIDLNEMPLPILKKERILLVFLILRAQQERKWQLRLNSKKDYQECMY